MRKAEGASPYCYYYFELLTASLKIPVGKFCRQRILIVRWLAMRHCLQRSTMMHLCMTTRPRIHRCHGNSITTSHSSISPFCLINIVLKKNTYRIRAITTSNWLSRRLHQLTTESMLTMTAAVHRTIARIIICQPNSQVVDMMYSQSHEQAVIPSALVYQKFTSVELNSRFDFCGFLGWGLEIFHQLCRSVVFCDVDIFEVAASGMVTEICYICRSRSSNYT